MVRRASLVINLNKRDMLKKTGNALMIRKTPIFHLLFLMASIKKKKKKAK
jgi:hypothetical protein